MRVESWKPDFARLAYVTFLFLPRLPSGPLPLHRALTDERLLSSDSPSSHAVIGLVDLNGQQRLIIKLASRKNQRHTFTATRPCFCRTYALLPKHNCPIRVFWDDVIRNTLPGDALFPGLQGGNVNRIVKTVFDRVEIQDAERYTSHCFRLGAANAILHSGSTLAEILLTGGWKSSGFKVYLDIQQSEETSTRAVLAGGRYPLQR